MNQVLMVLGLLLFLLLPQIGCNKTHSGENEATFLSGDKSYNNPLLFEGKFLENTMIRMVLFLDEKKVTGIFYKKTDFIEITLEGKLLPNNKLLLKSNAGVFEGVLTDSLFSGSYRTNNHPQQIQNFEFRKISLGYEITKKRLTWSDSTQNLKCNVEVVYPFMQSDKYTAFQEQFNEEYDTSSHNFFNEYKNMYSPFLIETDTINEEKKESKQDFSDSYKIPQEATSYNQITFISPSVLSISQHDWVFYGGNRAWDFYHLNNFNLLLAKKEKFEDQFVPNSGANTFIANYSYKYLKKNNPEIFEFSTLNALTTPLTKETLDYTIKNKEYNLFHNFSFSSNSITVIISSSTTFGRLTNISIVIPFDVLKPYVAKNSILYLIMKER